jgi:hypothetical protein
LRTDFAVELISLKDSLQPLIDRFNRDAATLRCLALVSPT